MTYYPDLSPYEYRPDSVQAYNIGWLDESYSFPTGTTPDAFHERLLEHCRVQFTVHHCLGFHTCQFCPRPVTAVRAPWGEEQVSLGNGELRVIGTDAVYAAPTLVYHYVVNHSYLPPDEFVQAVLAGPRPGTDEHRILLSMIEGKFRASDLPPEVKHRLVHQHGETTAQLGSGQLAQLLHGARDGQSLTVSQLAQILRANGPQLDADTIFELMRNTHIKRPRARHTLDRLLQEYSFGLVRSLDELVQIFQTLDELVAPQQRDALASSMIDDLRAGNWTLRAPLPYFLKEYARAGR